jgi:hypothetical protein
MSEEERITFFRGQHGFAVGAGEQLAAIYDFSRFGRVLEVVAGSGGVATLSSVATMISPRSEFGGRQ